MDQVTPPQAPRKILIRLLIATLLYPGTLLLVHLVASHAPNGWLGRPFSAWWIGGLALVALGSVTGSVLRLEPPPVVRRRWGLWLAGGLFASLGSLALLVGTLLWSTLDRSRALTTLPCDVGYLEAIRSCRSWGGCLADGGCTVVLGRGRLEPSKCRAVLAPRSATGTCDRESPETWAEVPCVEVRLPQASRCFQCLWSSPDDEWASAHHVIGLVDGCQDAIFFVGTGGLGLGELERELPFL